MQTSLIEYGYLFVIGTIVMDVLLLLAVFTPFEGFSVLYQWATAFNLLAWALVLFDDGSDG